MVASPKHAGPPPSQEPEDEKRRNQSTETRAGRRDPPGRGRPTYPDGRHLPAETTSFVDRRREIWWPAGAMAAVAEETPQMVLDRSGRMSWALVDMLSQLNLVHRTTLLAAALMLAVATRRRPTVNAARSARPAPAGARSRPMARSSPSTTTRQTGTPRSCSTSCPTATARAWCGIPTATARESQQTSSCRRAVGSPTECAWASTEPRTCSRKPVVPP
ncbi:hypothetical protein SAMN05661093_11265 [Kibdelosporangium aridum]|uniref:Uncharacterized protein n=1 Tax=Kibdelosporangium aridum TaxID=2030 RepID=A0A1W2FZU2_KIBAR|nr:hypothetical protein SAMN05661093_10853 [Kibdelosporangium aridum]SMD27455.1 hypothetical protein SAMN05661093_11062 [Kibdelosporangium aridum]SMD27620.1 hypothetical protein SAMN05661093_11230 [Kibdelosporangium aridum]SMD27655.1 hypothetical protein SAMN05661093_11265 [Kibdelosporangium aridum]